MGYRLDIVREPAIPTAGLCTGVAGATMERLRLKKTWGELAALPNCGIELFDVIEVRDRWTNLRGSGFRVSAISLVYERNSGTIRQTISLCAV